MPAHMGMWPTRSSLSRDTSAISHVALDRGRIKRPVYTLNVEGVEVVTTLTMADVERMLPTPGQRLSWARYVDRLTRDPLRMEIAEVAV